jgi:hypothetical protein
MFNAVCKLGLEGIVSEKLDAPYKSGPSKTWLKIKNSKAGFWAVAERLANFTAYDLQGRSGAPIRRARDRQQWRNQLYRSLALLPVRTPHTAKVLRG